MNPRIAEIKRDEPRLERLGLSLTKSQKRTLKRAARKAGIGMAELLQPAINTAISELEEQLTKSSQHR